MNIISEGHARTTGGIMAQLKHSQRQTQQSHYYHKEAVIMLKTDAERIAYRKRVLPVYAEFIAVPEAERPAYVLEP